VFAALTHHLGTPVIPFDGDPAHWASLDFGVFRNTANHNIFALATTSPVK
jgi:hypothetical protein